MIFSGEYIFEDLLIGLFLLDSIFIGRLIATNVDALGRQVEHAREAAGVNYVDMFASAAALRLQCTRALKGVDLNQVAAPAIVVGESHCVALIHEFKRDSVNVSAVLVGTGLQEAGHTRKANGRSCIAKLGALK